jgi:zinc transport system substrate-binding protein
MRIFLVISLLFALSCKEKPQPEQAFRHNSVAVSNYPLFWICDALLDKSVKVIYNIPKDIDPAFWEPNPEDLRQLLEVDKIFLNGATYEKWLETTSLPSSKMLDTTETLKEQYILIKNATTHAHAGNTHSHDGTAFTTWLNPIFLLKQISTIGQELKRLYPQQKENIQRKTQLLQEKINNIDQELKTIFLNQKSFLASHPVYQNFAKAYDLKIQSFLWEPEQMPSSQEWLEFETKKSHSRFMLWENEPSEEIQKELLTYGIQAIIFRPCGNTPPSKDYLAEMQQNITNLKNALGPKK